MQGWGSPRSKPWTYIINTQVIRTRVPAGGITGRDARDLVQIIRAVAGLARNKGEKLDRQTERTGVA